MKAIHLDLQAQNQPLEAEFQQALAPVLQSGAFIGGLFVQQFEQDLGGLYPSGALHRLWQWAGCFAARPDGTRHRCRGRGHRPLSHLHRHLVARYALGRHAHPCRA